MTVGNKTMTHAQTVGGLFLCLSQKERVPLVRGAAWAIVGSIYGLVFTFAHAWTPIDLFPLAEMIIPTVTTTAFVALMYGSMRLTVIASIYTSAAIVAAFLLRGGPIQIEPLISAGGITGAIVGTVFGWRVKSSRICRADAKIIAGLTAGMLASLSVVLPGLLGAPLPFHLQVLLAAPLSGLLYIGLAPHCVCRFSDILPPPADGAIVGAGVGLLMAALFWMMSGTLDGYLVEADQLLVNQMTERLPSTIFAAASGAFMVGIARSLMKLGWYDL